MRRVLVLGAAGGIGVALTKVLAEAGYVIDRTVHRQAAPDMAGLAEGRVFTCDLACREARLELTAALTGLEQPYYGLIHCAGATHDALVMATDDLRARRVMEVNFWSLVDVARAVLPAMSRARRGRVLAIGSIAAVRGRRGNAIYSASKAAVSGFVRVTAAELAGRGVTVNEIQAGFVDTPMLEPYGEARGPMAQAIPVRRLGSPGEIAEAARYLMSDGAGYVTGSSLVADGGLSAILG